jgi:hypothetical protein
MTTEPRKLAWREKEWRGKEHGKVPISHGTYQNLVNSKAIPTRLVTPRLRLILVSPEDYVAGNFSAPGAE